MGDTLRAQKPTLNGPTPPMKRAPPKRTQPEQPRLSQPQNVDGPGNGAPGENRNNGIGGGSGIANAAPGLSRLNSQAFLFNPGRQDSMLTLLSTYPLPNTQQPGAQKRLLNNDASFPSYYMGGPRDSVGGANMAQLIDTPHLGRLRGDSIFLPPPVSSKHQDESPSLMGQGLGSSQPGQSQSVYQPQLSGQLRSNSIFSSLIQIPGSLGNSISGPSKNESSTKKDEYAGHDNKDSISQMWWNSAQLQLLLQQPKASKGSKLSFDLPNSFLENSGLMGSIAGMSNDSINAFLSSIQNNSSVDFNSMSDQQRRDSILKFINDQQIPRELQQQPRKSSLKATLREDIFDKSRGSASTQHSHGQRKLSLGMSDPSRLSPLSSMSSKSSNRYHDEPQSPKTSPSQMKRTLDPSETF